MQMPPPASISPMAALSLPMAAESAGHGSTAGIAPSQASAVTSGSNAFEELPDGLNFGPEFFGMDSWASFTGWPDIGQFPTSEIS
jgi:poly [ADP-ribose] polymerase